MVLQVTLVVGDCGGRTGNRCPIHENIELLLEIPPGRSDNLSGNGILLRGFDLRPGSRLPVIVVIVILVIGSRSHPFSRLEKLLN